MPNFGMILLFLLVSEGGKVKYKVTFEEKGKILVSGHHLAFDNMPKLEELSIGCRVVVKISNEKVEYKPGIMAELPSRKNRMRFESFTELKNLYIKLISSTLK